ncbi:MAG: hypothetical protein ACHRXM_07680 [Isosphaerales bacterium]
MNRYQLAKIVDWAGTLATRKRMQKVVYLLKVAGCPLEADYTLHHYGPYSQEVARLTDEMVRTNLLEEKSETSPFGVQYSYHLPEATKRKLDDYERSTQSRELLRGMLPYEDRAKRLINAELKDLEIAATLVYFRRQDGDWSLAAEKTRQFKNLDAGSPLLHRAEDLAKQIVS